MTSKLERRPLAPAALERYGTLLKKARKAELKTLNVWYTIFELRGDPFASEVDSSDTSYFVDREEVVDSIVFDVGVASRNIPLTGLFVGPSGSGKTATLRFVRMVLESLSAEHPQDFPIAGLYSSAQALFESNGTEDTDQEVQPWIRISRKRLDYLFVDDAQLDHIRTIVKELVHSSFKLFAISPLALDQVSSELRMTPKIMFLGPLKFDAAIDLLDRRVKGASLKRDVPTGITDMFEKKALEVLYDYSIGNPGLLLRCASKALEILRNHTINESQTKILGKFKVNEDTARQAARVVGCLQAKDGLQSLSKFKATIFEQILSTWMTPTQISSMLSKDRTTISRHLSDLKDIGLVEQSLRGRESYYRVTEPARVRYEMGKMPEG